MKLIKRGMKREEYEAAIQESQRKLNNDRVVAENAHQSRIAAIDAEWATSDYNS